jgi:tape measure domain-containing protein
MAQDAELKLKVSLDLAFFRQQISAIGTQLAGQPVQLNVKLDRRSVQNELNALGANIKRRSYTLNVNTNLKAEIENASKLAKALDELSRSRGAAQQGISQRLGLGQLLKGPQSGGLGSRDVERLYRAAARAGILEYSKEVARTKASAVAALEAVGSESVRGLLNGLKSEDEKLRAAAEYLGESLIKTVKDVLGIASPSREFKKIGQNVGEGFQQGMMSSMDKAFDAVEGLMRARMKVLDTIARGMFRIAGVDPAAIRAEAAQRRALPGVNFPATVPRRDIPIGPSGTGRALPPGAIPSALPGTAFGAQRYLPTALSDELKQILRGAAFAFVDSIRTQTRSVRIGMGASMQGALPAARIAGLLPAGVGREPSRYATGAIGGESREQMMARRTAEAYARSALRGMDVMGGGAGRPPSPYSYAYRSARPTSAIVPYAAGGAMVAGPRQVPEALTGQATPFASPLPKNYLEIGKAIKGLDPILQRSSVPFSGAIRELGEEFGFAIKQVLLFGTAYKALAFFTDLPAQALNASKELQSFNNQLNAITGSSSNAQRSVQFINDTVAQFNVPLQSAREGFLRLYASMSPAGMGADTIENLFVGISQASATLGLSADQVDRVTYAFSQMASKGKVMSEEVTGQLGDVIPGALSLMADAAGLSMAEFKQAMEDGQVSGKAMEQLFANLPIVMEQRFGKGAVGAAQTLQGQLNDLATTTQRMYESFEPLVTSIANQILPAVSAAMKDTQSAVEAFSLKMQGINPAVNLLSDNAQGLYRNFEIVYDTASSVGAIIQSLGGVFSTLGNIVSGALQVFNALAANPVGEFFVKLAVNIGIATAAINLFVKSGIIAATQQLLLFIGNMKLTIASLRTLIATSRAAKIALGGIVAGTMMVGLEMLVTHLTKVKEETDKVKNSALAAADAIRQMSYTQLIEQERSVKRLIQNIETLQRAAGGAMRITRPTPEQERMAREAGLPIIGRAGQRAISMTRAEGIRQQALEKLPEINRALEAPGQTAAATITPIDLQEKEGKNKTGEGRQLSVDDLIGGDIKRKLDERRSKLEVALARELNRAASAINPEQAERMVKSAAKLLDIKYQIDAIDQTITAREAVREKIIASSKDKAATALAFDEQTNDLKAARANLERDIEKAIIEQQGAAEQQARKEREEIERIRKEQAERIAENIKGLQDEIALLRTISKEEQNRLRIAQENKNATQEQLNQIYDLEKVRDNIKAVRETIDSFVTETSSDYKGFLKEVISGEDAVESLKKFQQGLKDRVLTIFLDFAMAPVEKFFKEMAAGNFLKMFFPETAAEQAPEEKLVAPVEANTSAVIDNTSAIRSLTQAIGSTAIPSTTGMGVGNDLAAQLTQERGYEDVAGLLPLPIQRMQQQAARPLRMIWQQIQGAMEGVYGATKKQIQQTFKPDPQRNQQVLQRVQKMQDAVLNWNPLEAQWKETENQMRTNKRSKPSSIPAASLVGVAQSMYGSISDTVRGAGGLAVGRGERLGSMLDFSDYLSPQQAKILGTGIKEVLSKAMDQSFAELRQFTGNNRDPSAMPSFQKAISDLTPIVSKFKGVFQETLSQEAASGHRYAQDAMKRFGMPAPVGEQFYRSPQYTQPGLLQEQLERLMEQPRIQPGVEGQFEGAMLPGAAFDISKISQSFGEIATASDSLSGLLANMTQYSSGIKQNAETVNSSLSGISQAVGAAGEEAGENGKEGSKFKEALGKTVQGIGIAAGAIMGIASGIGQIKEGGTSNVLGGIGMIASMAGSLLGSFGGLFGGGAGASSIVQGVDMPVSQMPAGMAFANGGIAFGGFRAFANGGTVSGPTLGLVGEGKYNEAVVPLPDGRSIPVQLGSGSSRDLLGGKAKQQAASPILSMNFQSTTINGVEYVDRAQLEAAMAETRKMAARDGAAQGSQLALSKLRNSPSTRRQLGMS